MEIHFTHASAQRAISLGCFVFRQLLLFCKKKKSINNTYCWCKKLKSLNEQLKASSLFSFLIHISSSLFPRQRGGIYCRIHGIAHLERRPQKAIPVCSRLGSNGPRPEAIRPPTHRPRPQAMHTTPDRPLEMLMSP